MRWYLVSQLALLLLHAVTQSGSILHLLDTGDNWPSGRDDDTSGRPTPTGCPLCGQNVDRVDAVKVDILRKLRMVAPPNMTNYKRLPDIPSLHHLMDTTNNSSKTLHQLRRANIDEDHALNLTVIALSQPVYQQPSFNLPNVIQFKINVDTSDVETANLSFFIRSTSNEPFGTKYLHQRAPRRQVTLLVNKVFVSPDGQYKTAFYRRFRELAPPPGHWTTLDVKSMFNDRQYVEQLRNMETVTLLMQIVIEETRHRTEVVTPSEQVDKRLDPGNDDQGNSGTPTSDNTATIPFIELRVNEHGELTENRRRRNSKFGTGAECDESTHESRCCRYPLSIDFVAMGWTWILAPKRFEAFYCSGICPFLYHQVGALGHLRQQSGTQQDGSPCCAPTKVSSLPLVYIDEGGSIVFGTLPGIVVERCGCA